MATEDYLERLGVTLSAVMDYRGVRPPELARALGVDQQTVYRWQGGQHAPTAGMMTRLTEALNAPADLLLNPLPTRGSVLAAMGAWDELLSRPDDGRPYPWMRGSPPASRQ